MSVESITQNALKALLYEVVTNPKPGLVDPVDVGSHPDMNAYMFIDSSISLRSYFHQAASIGASFDKEDLHEMFESLRKVGIEAEKTMFTTTSNVNTHKGAIFSLGLFVCAAAYCEKNDKDEFLVVKQMTKGLVKRDLGKSQLTAGERQFVKYGKGGARAQAEAGYPLVKEVALPFLKQSKGDLNIRLLDTLMKIVSEIEDSNLIKRANNIEIIPWAQMQAKHYLALGGYGTPAGKQYMHQLNQTLKRKNLSLGGSADILILTIFIALQQKII